MPMNSDQFTRFSFTLGKIDVIDISALNQLRHRNDAGQSGVGLQGLPENSLGWVQTSVRTPVGRWNMPLRTGASPQGSLQGYPWVVWPEFFAQEQLTHNRYASETKRHLPHTHG